MTNFDHKSTNIAHAIHILILSFSCSVCSLLLTALILFLYPFVSFSLQMLLVLFSACFFSTILGLVFCSKICDQKLLKQEKLLLLKEHKLAEAEKETMRANLLRAVSHDLRTPLTGIIGNSMAYLENRDSLASDEKENLIQNIYEDANWMINMVENLLTVTRIQNDTLKIKKNEELVEEVIAEALQRMQKRHPDCSIHVTAPDDFILLPMDPILIEQVIINLLENALYHSGSTIPLEFIVVNQPDSVSFTIKDHGKGIPPEMLSHLFEGKFYSTDSADVIKGMGIGLAICKTIVTAHQGIISGKNHDSGAEFTFILPKKENEIL